MIIKHLKYHLAKLIEYNWERELEDYVHECGDDPEDNMRKGHIFETLVKLDNFVNDSDTTLQEYVDNEIGESRLHDKAKEAGYK